MKNVSRFIPTVVLCALLLAVCVLVPSRKNHVQAQSSSFTFGVAGDFSMGSQFTKTISNMAAGQLNFIVPVGDFSYSYDAATWSTAVRNAFPNGFPVQIIAGNHDNNIGVAPFIAGLPNHMSTISTDSLTYYGEQYYFDYPIQSPYMRFVLLGQDEGSPSYTYPAGSVNLNWATAAIDGARTKNIPWVVVGMHKNCITSGTKSGCAIGTALFNMLIAKKVDLILQGHDHNYQRSYPLKNATSHPTNASGCTTVSTTFNSACITQSSNTYPSSNGTTLIIAGTGGSGLYANSNTSQNPYFAAGQYTQNGYVKFTASPSQLSGTFISNSSGGYTDSFTITKSGVTNPTVTPNPSCPARTLGDADCDGKHNLVDFEIWRREFTGLLSTTTADFNTNATTKPDLVDYEIWLRNFGL